MLDAIYASKLYRASKRKDAISAALQNQNNVGLVTQLASYLDEPYQDLVKEKKPIKKEESTDEVVDDFDEGVETKESGASHHAGGGHGISIPDSMNPGLEEDFNVEDNLVTVDDSDLDTLSEDASSPEPSDNIEESENVYGSTDITERVDVIKGTLNGRDDTEGVSRIHIKDNEMWIYYSDDTNLNNIMTSVIEYLNAAGYTDLEFNRLARSDNAIVFVIDSVQEPIKPVETVEGK